MLPENKTANIYGAVGHIGSAITRTFAREGAGLFLVGRPQSTVRKLAEDLGADSASFDILEATVERHVNGVMDKTQCIDVSINATSIRGDLQGTSLVETQLSGFITPSDTRVRENFLTIRTAARHMAKQGFGTILTLSAASVGLCGRDRVYHKTGGFSVACTAIEAMNHSFAGELGRHGVCVVCLRSDALPETWPCDAEPQWRHIEE
jgi:NAD(P)-dependent dehydrogenase (short-subunit alcohol dehydrogenase family)